MQVDLVDAATGRQLWGQSVSNALPQSYFGQANDRAGSDGEAQAEAISGDEQHELTKRDTTNAEAYQFYLRGRYYWNNRTPGRFGKSHERISAGGGARSRLRAGLCGLADCYSILEDYTGAEGGIEKAKGYAERALQLDDSLAETHASLGNVYHNVWRWVEAEREFKRAIELNPKYPTARHWYGNFLRDLGRNDEAMAEMRRAQELDPLSPIINQNVALNYAFRGELDKAARHYEKIIELNPDFPGAHAQLGFYVYLRQERFDAAIAEIQQGVELSRRSSWWLAYLANAYGKAGQPDAASMIIQELLQRHDKNEANGYVFALAYAGLGDLDKSLFLV